MRVYTSNNRGCFIGVIVLFIVFMIVGMMTRFLFTTPLGLILVIGFGAWYFLRARQEKADHVDGKQEPDHTRQGWVDPEVSRQAVDVEYEEVKEREPEE